MDKDEKLAGKWDDYGLFRELLEEFSRHLAESRRAVILFDPSYMRETADGIRLGKVGYALFRPVEEWGHEHALFLESRLKGELTPASMRAFGEDSEAVAMFTCLALGAMQAKFVSGEIDRDGFLRGDAHLAAFLMANARSIGDIYREFAG